MYLEEGGVEFGFSAQTAFVQGYNFGLWRGVLAAEEFDVRVGQAAGLESRARSQV